MYSITLNDGTRIEGLTLKGNIFWSNTELTHDMFRGKMTRIIISGSPSEGEDNPPDVHEGTYEHMRVVYIRKINGKYALALGAIPLEEWKNEQRDGNIAYIAMMAGVKL